MYAKELLFGKFKMFSYLIYLRQLEEVCSVLLPCGFRSPSQFSVLLTCRTILLASNCVNFCIMYYQEVLGLETFFTDLGYSGHRKISCERRELKGKKFKKQTRESKSELRMRLGADRLLDPYPWTDCKPSELASCAA